MTFRNMNDNCDNLRRGIKCIYVIMLYIGDERVVATADGENIILDRFNTDILMQLHYRSYCRHSSRARCLLIFWNVSWGSPLLVTEKR